MKKILLFLGLGFLTLTTACQSGDTAQPAATSDVQTATAGLFVNWGSFHTPPYQVCPGLQITSGTSTVLDLMNTAQTACSPPIQFTYTGSGSSAFLTSINGVTNNQNNNGYYWVYLVNGQSPTIGFGAYRLNAGDLVVWNYLHFSSGLRQATDPDA